MLLGNAFKLQTNIKQFELTDLNGLKAWYKFRTGITVDGNDDVTEWSDSSGNTSEDMDITPKTDTTTAYNSSTGGLTFTTANKSELLTASDQLNLGQFTIFGVLDLTEAGASNEGFFGRAGNDEFRLYRGGNTLHARLRANGVNYDLTNTNSTPTGKFLMTLYRESDGNVQLRFKGIDEDNVATAIANLFDFTRIGNGAFDGIVYELAIYNTRLTDAQILDVEANINQRNGL